MKPSEALELLSKYTPSLEWVEANKTDEDVNGCDEVLEMHEAHRVLQELVKRDEAIKPTFYTNRNICCSICGNKYMPKVWKFCPECGQRLDWSDEE